MSIHDVYDGAQLIAASMDILTRHQMSLTVGEDFEEYRDILKTARPDHALGVPFDPNLQDITPSNSFWIVGRTPGGQVAHTQAMRLLDIGDGTLSDYLREHFRNFPPSIPGLDMEKSRFRAGPGARSIRGQVCYHGEVWLNADAGNYRGSGVSSVLGRFAFMTAMLRWSPDYVFGFMPKSVAYKGFVERQGYMHAEPNALHWARLDDAAPMDAFLAYMAKDDIRFLMSMPLQELVA